MSDDTEKGLYQKYQVQRVNDPDGKHDECEYFVLDPKHDPHARIALVAYAGSCMYEYPQLSADIKEMLDE